MAKGKARIPRPKAKVAAPLNQGVVRRSVSLDREIDALAHELVGESNFSAFVNEAVRQKTQQIQMLRLLDDLDAEFGPVGKAAMGKAKVLWQNASRSTRAR